MPLSRERVFCSLVGSFSSQEEGPWRDSCGCRSTRSTRSSRTTAGTWTTRRIRPRASRPAARCTCGCSSRAASSSRWRRGSSRSTTFGWQCCSRPARSSSPEAKVSRSSSAARSPRRSASRPSRFPRARLSPSSTSTARSWTSLHRSAGRRPRRRCSSAFRTRKSSPPGSRATSTARTTRCSSSPAPSRIISRSGTPSSPRPWSCSARRGRGRRRRSRRCRERSGTSAWRAATSSASTATS